MKKLKIVLLSLSVCFAYSSCVHKSNNPKTFTNLVFRSALNGYADTDAIKMVAEFQKSPGYYDEGTTSWVSRKFVDTVDSLLQNDVDADGVRLYLARKNDINTFIWVSTRDDGPDKKAVRKTDHVDYFKHSDAFFLSDSAKSRDQETIGASLYFKKCKNAGCTIVGEHVISCYDARTWVLGYDTTKVIDLKSEWFDKKLIHHFTDEFKNAKIAGVNADGLRIYLGYNMIKKRFVIMFVTTKGVSDGKNTIHEDYYECYSKEDKGGYDNGEQCPNNCKGTTLP